MEVLIYHTDDGIYYSEMVFSDGTNDVRIDSRTSDAIAIALRMDCDIYTYESIMQKCSITLNEDDAVENEEVIFTKDIMADQLEDTAKLHEWLRLLQKVIQEERYELAKIFKEELIRREQEEDNA